MQHTHLSPELRETFLELRPDRRKSIAHVHSELQNLRLDFGHSLRQIPQFPHMLFEYRTAWPHVRAGGILLSDDTDFNAAFPEFATTINRPTVMFNFRVGAIRKPTVAAETL